MKRFLIILLLLVLSFTLCFAACGETEDDGKPNNGGNGTEQTVDGESDNGGVQPTDGNDGGQTTDIETDENELPLIPLN